MSDNDRTRLTVDIYGTSYRLMGKSSLSYMKAVAAHVDDQMHRIAAGNGRLDMTKIAVLAAVNMADEYLKLKEELDRALRELDNLGQWESKFTALQEDYGKLLEEHARLRETADEDMGRYQEAWTQWTEERQKLELQAKQLQADLNKVVEREKFNERSQRTISEERSRLEQENARLKREWQQEQEKLGRQSRQEQERLNQELRQERERHQQELEQVRREIEEERTRLRTESERQQQLHDEEMRQEQEGLAREFEQELERLRQENQRELELHRSEASRLGKDKAGLENELEGLRAELDRAAERIKISEAAEREAREQLAGQYEETEDVRRLLREEQARMAALDREERGMAAEYDDLKAEYEKLKKEYNEWIELVMENEEPTAK